MCFTPLLCVANSAQDTINPQNIQSPLLSENNIELDYPIEPVRERDYGGKKIAITTIKLMNVIGSNERDWEEFDDEEGSVQDLIDNKIKELMGKMSYDDLDDLAFDITRHFVKKQDTFLAKVYIPAQQVQNGMVKFALLKGKLGDVDVENNSLYQTKALTVIFDQYRNEVVKKQELEGALMRLFDFPGLNVIGEFSPGNSLGYTQLKLKATEQHMQYRGFTDNYGSEFTGKARLGGELQLNNQFEMKDELRLLAYITETPAGIEDNSDLGAIDCCDGLISYSFAIDQQNEFRANFSVSKASYDVGNVDEVTLAAFGFAGETLTLSSGLQYLVHRSKSFNAWTRFDISKMNAKTLRSVSLLSEDNILTYQASIESDFSDGFALFGSSNADNRSGLRVQLTRGKLSNGNAGKSRLEADDDFTKLTYSFERKQELLDTLDLKLSLAGQFTRNQLVGSQQMGIGGPSSVRAYPPGAFLADKGLFTAADLVWDASDFFKNSIFKPLGFLDDITINTTPSIFIDYANASVVDGETFAVKQVGLGSYGFGLNLSFNNKTSVTFIVAKALGSSHELAFDTSSGGQDVVGRRDIQLYTGLRSEF